MRPAHEAGWRRPLSALLGAVDLLMAAFVGMAALLLLAVRRTGLQRLPVCRWVLVRIGLLPVRRHYYEPFPDPRGIVRGGQDEREIIGIEWNIGGQLAALEELRFEGEIPDLAAPRKDQLEFRLNNGAFESGDAEFLYQMVRARKPRRFIEIGSGQSTLIVRRAIQKNREESPGYECRHVCIEPFEAPWLEKLGVTVLRQRVETVAGTVFAELDANDFLFVDSSHVIRPQGDVLSEYLRIIPSLRSGVIVHIHDIFSPREYPREWLVERMWLWNEQYLLEALLIDNPSWRIIGALNLLHHSHFEALRRVCPYLTPDREPGSFYMQKV
ncbi:MAG: class I SAM-dependent methyltransferase [Steroidobacteraceae bacterium]